MPSLDPEYDPGRCFCFALINSRQLWRIKQPVKATAAADYAVLSPGHPGDAADYAWKFICGQLSAMPKLGSTFEGVISVAISGLPSGLNVSPSSLTAGPGTYGWFPVKITADASLPVGVYPFTLTGTSGSMSYSMTIAVGLVQPPPQPAALQSQVIYSFTGQLDGGSPSGPLISDSAGNLYGTAFIGRAYGTGVVFELSFSNGAWQETVLHSFGNGNDGAGPIDDLIFDAAGICTV